MGKTYRKKPYWVDERTWDWNETGHVHDKNPINIPNKETRDRRRKRDFKDNNKMRDGWTSIPIREVNKNGSYGSDEVWGKDGKKSAKQFKSRVTRRIEKQKLKGREENE